MCEKLGDTSFQLLGSSEKLEICNTYRGKVLLVVNTASQCMFTPQYEGLETLHQKYANDGLVILGFPSNDFGAQEPGENSAIKSFCQLNYGVSFPMFAKTTLKGDQINPLYKVLIELSGTKPRWNFHKYLIGRNGELVGSYSSWTKPLSRSLVNDIERAL
ncbi:MAG: glutathione peroxidase [bacterium]